MTDIQNISLMLHHLSGHRFFPELPDYIDHDWFHSQADVNAETDDEETPLWRAVNSHSYECAELLLENGSNANCQGDQEL